MTPETGLIVFMAAAGAFVHSASGFGFAMLFMPVAGYMLGIHHAAPLMALLSTMLTAYVGYMHRTSVDWPEARRLILSAVPGLAVGLMVLQFSDPAALKKLLGASLAAYGAYALFLEPRIRPVDAPALPFKRSWMGIGAGFLAGFFGGSCAVDGPPLIVYSAIRRWPRERFKGVLQAFFLANNAMLFCGHAAIGNVSGPVLLLGAACIPALAAGVYLGHHASSRLSPEAFRRCVLSLIAALGAMLLLG